MKSILNIFLGLSLSAMAILQSCGSDDSEEDISGQLAIDNIEINTYIAVNALQNVQTSETSLRYIITEVGTGEDILVQDIVSVHYEGRYLDGRAFDSSYDRGEPLTYNFGIGAVVPGFDEGVLRIGDGGKGTIIVPSYLAYGASGYGDIAPNEILVFDMEVLSDAQILETENEAIDEYISENSLTGLSTTQTGLRYIITTPGEGDNAMAGNTVECRYEGRFLDGNIFDNNGGVVLIYNVGDTEVISGWNEGVSLLNKGAKATFILPSSLAYGRLGNSRGSVPIPANTVVLFDIEIIDIR
ncbi:MAG: FKBP-type peptidyl-prolyl cis-trans isomerase [Cyclobacteriaceae bacterium]